MIIHKLIARHLAHRDDAEFYSMQARDAIHWIERNSGPLRPGLEALDLGAGHGIFGAELVKRGCKVVFADEINSLLLPLREHPFRQINLDQDDVAKLGSYDLIICSNVLEHLARPSQFLASIANLLKPAGRFYLSWTNWLSPWGGHEFSPFHYLGTRLGPRVYERVTGRKRLHTLFVNLFPTYIGQILRELRSQPKLRLVCAAPRYYPEFRFVLKIPIVREFVTWNCAVLISRTD